MKTFVLTSVATLILLGGFESHAATTIVDYTVNTSIPDDTATGVTDTRTVSGSTILGITQVDLRLEFSGGWNGDLYAYLTHSSGFAVALNRPGKTLLDSIGSGSSGMTITLSDLAATDIHTGMAGSGYITGTYQPDARNVDPADVLNTDPRTAFLSSFNGLAADGTWTLFVADMSAGDESTLVGWGMTINGSVPEPSRTLLMMAGLVGTLLRRRRRPVAP